MNIKETIQAIIPGAYCDIYENGPRKIYSVTVKHHKGGTAYILADRQDSEDAAWALAAVTIARKFNSK